jgi:hypothetical protein
LYLNKGYGQAKIDEMVGYSGSQPKFPNYIYYDPYTNASLTNSWVNYVGTYPNAGYTKLSSGMVVLRGAIKSGTLGSSTAAFTLPTTHCPAYDMVFNGIDNANASCAIYVRSTGAVCVATGNNLFISLEGIRFPT